MIKEGTKTKPPTLAGREIDAPLGARMNTCVILRMQTHRAQLEDRRGALGPQRAPVPLRAPEGPHRPDGCLEALLGGRCSEAHRAAPN